MEDWEARCQKLDDLVVKLRLTQSALEWQLKDLVLWKERADLAINAVQTQLAELVKADEIADAVSKRIHKTNSVRLTFVQKSIGLLVAGIAIADFIKGVT